MIRSACAWGLVGSALRACARWFSEHYVRFGLEGSLDSIGRLRTEFGVLRKPGVVDKIGDCAADKFFPRPHRQKEKLEFRSSQNLPKGFLLELRE